MNFRFLVNGVCCLRCNIEWTAIENDEDELPPIGSFLYCTTENGGGCGAIHQVVEDGLRLVNSK